MAESSSSTSAVVTAKSDAETEEMLDRMLTRLAFCDDSKLQALLSKLLPITISSLSSHSSAVRNKEKENLAPMLLMNVSKLPHQHQEILLRIITKVIGECHSNQVDDRIAAKYRILNDPHDRELFIEFCLHTVLYQLSSQSRGCPPGLSIAQTNRAIGKQSLDMDILLQRKLGILNVVDAMELAPELSNISQLKLMGPVILNAILKSLDSHSSVESVYATARDTKTFSFQAIGLLAQRMPQLFRIAEFKRKYNADGKTSHFSNKIDMAVLSLMR
ncbi:hypothetical protein FNV43_RR05732 [Rhamnella rubrinervis]|uniref:Proteasome component Ecm29 N-terminal domain-containing protein n=1 Tax=Rhamnella rubrinervis TaxID=2594499 RepID=A0A8K0MRE1_9ROSA|nr:hypothetical protein FNV43_RR05732 [Rhamnella rubrinervis]